MKRILLALELDDHTDLLLEKALQLGLCFESSIWLVHIAAPDPDFVGYEVGPQYIRDARADVLKAEHKQLEEYAKVFEKQGLEVHPVLLKGATVDMLLLEAYKMEIDLIITGHHKKGPLSQFFEGSISKELIYHATIPVMIVPLK